jgi:hypothetical protein
MHLDDERPLKEYVGFIWIGEEPGIRLNVWAVDSEDAWTKVVADYGEGHVISIWNEADASKPRRRDPCDD